MECSEKADVITFFTDGVSVVALIKLPGCSGSFSDCFMSAQSKSNILKTSPVMRFLTVSPF